MLKDGFNKLIELLLGYRKGMYDKLTKASYIDDNNNDFRLNLVIPFVDKRKMYGGHTTAYKFFFNLADTYGCEKRIIVDSEIVKEVQEQYPDYKIVKCDSNETGNLICQFNSEVRKRNQLAVRKKDIFITTYWVTNYFMTDVLNYQMKKFGIQNELVYLIQDFEPSFYRWSADYLLVDSTYKNKNTIAVFNSHNLYDYFKTLGYKFKKELVFSPKINEVLLNELIKNKKRNIVRKKQIIVYGRPHAWRNAFPLIIEGLNYFIKNYEEANEWDFISIGKKHRDIKLENGRQLKSIGKLTLEEYSQILLESSVGVSLMCSPHPSYPPLEMASFGVKTITNSFVCKDLSEFNPNIISIDQVNIETLGKAIINAVKIDTNNAIDYNSSYYSPQNQFNDIIPELKYIFEEDDNERR